MFLVVLDMLAAKRQQPRCEATTRDENAAKPDNVAVYPLAILFLIGWSVIMWMIIVTGGFSCGGLSAVPSGYAALPAVMVATGLILNLTILAEGWVNERITIVFLRVVIEEQVLKCGEVG
jgi:small neutral amino acid transporter SnatA (MarC family)